MNAKVIQLRPQLVRTISIETDFDQFEEISFYLASPALSSEIGHHIHTLETEDQLEYHLRNAVESTLRDSCGMGGDIYIHKMPIQWKPKLEEILNEFESE